MGDVSRVSDVNIREVWKNEALNFTPWLLANAEVLGEVLGMDLDLRAAEHPVGDFSLDLIGTDLATGEEVIVENQLARSDHTHLGQILTYAGGTDPVNIVWITESFRPEHRAALDWLNGRTDEGTRFFGVEVRAIRIDDSAPAPLFTVVANPNNWRKEIRSATGTSVSPRVETYQRFWTLVLTLLKDRYPGWTAAKSPSKRQWMALPAGTTAAMYGLVVLRDAARVEIYLGDSEASINKSNFEKLERHRDTLEQQIGTAMKWEELPDRRASRISINRDADFQDEDSWPELADWLTVTAGRLRDVLDHLGGLPQLLR